MVLLPMLLLLMDPSTRPALVDSVKTSQWWITAGLTCMLLWIVFDLSGLNHFRYLYLLFLPVVWLSAKLGVGGAVLSSALVQVGLIFAIQVVPNEDLAVFEFQILMAAITMTGLLLGVAVDERTRAEINLRSSLRLAAAGQMAASLAHELSQPLTALNNYAQACQMLVTDASGLNTPHREQLIDVTQKMIDDASRAGTVVKSLRDFFRTGSTQLHEVSPETVLIESIVSNLRRAETINIRIENQITEGLPLVWMDPLQISVVMRNLIANAIDSAATSDGNGLVMVGARIVDSELQIEVRDNGAGIDPRRMQILFDAGPSDKPGGMGIGLSICRAIVEAHGGRLWAEVGAGGCFRFTLPVETGNQSDAKNT
jgi:signal transduction histidine kinase